MRLKFKKYWRKSSFKQKGVGDFFLKLVSEKKPKNFLEIGVFHGVTSRNICELLNSIHGDYFKYTGIDIFSEDLNDIKNEFIPNTSFSNPFKNIYYKYLIRENPYSVKSVSNLLKKFKKNVTILKGNSNELLKNLNLNNFDYVFLDGGHRYETVLNDLNLLTNVLNNNGVILCDDYDLTYASGVKKAIDEFVLKKNFNLRILNSRFAEITNL
jgi:predicted O-methyltransferase YrrM